MNRQKVVGILLCLAILNTNLVTCFSWGDVVVGALIGGTAIICAPVALGVAGFSSAGIAAGSVGASMMSASAVANGGAVAAGSMVSVLQSVGAAGLAVGTKAAFVTATTAAYTAAKDESKK